MQIIYMYTCVCVIIYAQVVTPKCQVERGVRIVSMTISFPFFQERIMPFPWQENMQQTDRFGVHSVLGHPWRLLKRG